MLGHSYFVSLVFFLLNVYVVSHFLLFHSVFFLFLSCGALTRFRVMASPYGAMGSNTLNASHSVWLLWTSDQPVAETSTWQHTTLTRDKNRCLGEIRSHNPSKWSAIHPSFIPRARWDLNCHSLIFILSFFLFLLSLYFSCLKDSSKLYKNFASAGANFTDMEISLFCLSH